MFGNFLRSALVAGALLSSPAEPGDIRLRCLKSAQKADPEFPDGRAVKLTHFGYLGSLESPDGPVSVIDQRGVIAGMLAPRGLNYVAFCGPGERYLGKLSYGISAPYGAKEAGCISGAESNACREVAMWWI